MEANAISLVLQNKRACYLDSDEMFKNRQKLGPSMLQGPLGGQPANESLRDPFNVQIELCSQSARVDLVRLVQL